jgi:hypothetical protein
MKAYILYHPNSDNARTVEQYIKDFESRHSKKLEILSLETREGASMATLYDIVAYPALLVTQDNSQLLKEWQGLPLPLMDEVAGYLNS